MSAVAGRKPVRIGGLSDDDLVALARDGHEPAFEAIVRRYRAPLVSYCRRWVDPHRAEEVVQHTLMKAFLCLRDDDRPLVLRPWLYRVAHNAALNALEKKGSDWEELDENYDGVPQPPQVAEQRARFLQVVGGIEALPLRQREALLLNEFEGRCYADIATELGTSESGVRGLLRRARRQLRETAAALLLPFPALREFLRSDGGRALQVDRAGELMGTAGAAGGIGAAGGVAKVAAGVLAAGTIAGGGTAIEQREGAWRAPERDTAGTSVLERALPVGLGAADGPKFLLSSPVAGSDALAITPVVLSGGHFVPGTGVPYAEGDRYAYLGTGAEGYEQDAADPGEPAEPVPAVDPPLPVSTEPKEEPSGEEPGSGEATEPDAKDPAPTTAPSGGDPPADEAEGTGGGVTDPPATPAAPVPEKTLQG